MDALYFFRHSVYGDVEIRYSLRSLNKYAPYIRKVWIFGDRPAFLSEEPFLIRHAPHRTLPDPEAQCFELSGSRSWVLSLPNVLPRDAGPLGRWDRD